jgi:hypothetical protein
MVDQIFDSSCFGSASPPWSSASGETSPGRDSNGPPPILKHFHSLHIARQNERQAWMHSPNFGVVPDDECFDPFNRSPALLFTSSNPYCEPPPLT